MYLYIYYLYHIKHKHSCFYVYTTASDIDKVFFLLSFSNNDFSNNIYKLYFQKYLQLHVLNIYKLIIINKNFELFLKKYI